MFLLTLKSIPLFLLTFVMFLIHPLTLKTIPMFLLTFVYFCDVSDSSIDFKDYSAISIDLSDVSIDFEDYSAISNSLFRCFY